MLKLGNEKPFRNEGGIDSMQNIRQRILQIIQERGRVTVAELAEILGMAPVSVRHHLDILQGDGFIRVDGVRRRSGAGRPQHVYGLTPEAYQVFPKNYDHLLHHLLSDLEERELSSQFQILMERVAHRMAQDAGVDKELRVQAPEAFLDQVVDFLNKHGYMAHWTQAEGTYYLHFANCPYVALIDQHPALCRLDQHMIRALLGEPSITVKESIREGAHKCVLSIPIPLAELA